MDLKHAWDEEGEQFNYGGCFLFLVAMFLIFVFGLIAPLSCLSDYKAGNKSYDQIMNESKMQPRD